MFSFFKKKVDKKPVAPIELRPAFEEIFAYLTANYSGHLERAREIFIQLTGQFDEDHEYFNNKLDDFRTWFVLFYSENNKPFEILSFIKGDEDLMKYYSYFANAKHAVFKVLNIKGDGIQLINLFSNEKFMVFDPLKAMSMEQGDLIQTSLIEVATDEYEFSPSAIFHPEEASKYIHSQVKAIAKKVKKDGMDSVALERKLLNDLMVMRYQLFKYHQVSIQQVYSEKGLFGKKA